uniref:Ig-like domain-containing protein n=1 Tax=Amphiprion ocellaris TaxID=80972 RepID=A0AAQ6ARB6_AMPOC
MLRFFIFGILIASTGNFEVALCFYRYMNSPTPIVCFTFYCVLAGKPVSAACKIEMSPPRVMVKFGHSLTANCTSLYSEIAGIGWESTYGGVGLQTGISTLPFKIDTVERWVIQPTCYVTLPNGDQCEEPLPVTVYQVPESVSIAQPLSEAGPMVEGKQYRIQCDIVNVAPASLLSVYWHKGNKIIYHETFKESTLSPVNKSSILNLTAQRDDDGSQISCEAKLDLGPGELNHSAVQSKSHEVAVLCEFPSPTGDRTTLAAIIGVFVALGVLLFVGGVLFVTRDGTFSCNQSKYLRGQPSGTV